jgi:hypothetical protein
MLSPCQARRGGCDLRVEIEFPMCFDSMVSQGLRSVRQLLLDQSYVSGKSSYHSLLGWSQTVESLLIEAKARILGKTAT